MYSKPNIDNNGILYSSGLSPDRRDLYSNVGGILHRFGLSTVDNALSLLMPPIGISATAWHAILGEFLGIIQRCLQLMEQNGPKVVETAFSLFTAGMTDGTTFHRGYAVAGRFHDLVGQYGFDAVNDATLLVRSRYQALADEIARQQATRLQEAIEEERAAEADNEGQDGFEDESDDESEREVGGPDDDGSSSMDWVVESI